MNFIAELRRRNVIRMAGLYLVVSWLTVQVAETVLPIFDTPGWVLKVMLVVLALGFLPALVFSWVFELTPEGLKRDGHQTAAESIAGQTGRRMDRLILIGALAVIAVLVVDRFRAPAAVSTPLAGADTAQVSSARSIAVLAFADLSADGDQAYFAEGISEELLNLLARIDGLKVAARTSSFSFKNGETDIREIGRKLDVEAVLEGSVRKAGDQVRVTAQLIDVRTGFHLWSQSYDRKLENIFAVQDEIASAIVGALSLKLDVGAATKTRTTNTEAFEHYLRGRQLSRDPKRDGLMRALAEYEQALALDPGYAAAYSGIAEAWLLLEDYGGYAADVAYAKAGEAAERALALDPGSVEALVAQAKLTASLRDTGRAIELFEQAFAINPNYSSGYLNYSDSLREIGEGPRALETMRKAVALDPLSAHIASRLVGFLNEAGQAQEARQRLDAILAATPNDDYAREEQGNIYLTQGRYADAIREFRFVHDARPGDAFSAARIVMAATYLEDEALAGAWLAEATQRGEDNRWVLDARNLLAEWQRDDGALAEIAKASSGRIEAHMQGVAAARRQEWDTARERFLASLSQLHFKDGAGLTTLQSETLIWLAWAEKQSGRPQWQDHLAMPKVLITRIVDEGGIQFGSRNTSNHYLLARIAAVEGDRATALAQLRKAAATTGFLPSWALANDPLFADWRDQPDFKAVTDGMRAHAAAERAKLDRKEAMP